MLLPLAHRIQSLQMDLTANYIINVNRAEPNITVLFSGHEYPLGPTRQRFRNDKQATRAWHQTTKYNLTNRNNLTKPPYEYTSLRHTPSLVRPPFRPPLYLQKATINVSTA